LIVEKEVKKMTARLLALALVLGTSAFAQRGEFVLPEGTDVTKFPILNKPITTAKMAQMGLTPKNLEKPTVVQNHFRKLGGKEGRFVLETLPIGTIVLVDRQNKIRYKADCANRLVEVEKCPVQDRVNSTFHPYGFNENPPPQKGWWQKFTDGLRNFAKEIWNFLGFLVMPFLWLLLALLGLVFLALLLYLLFRGVRAGINSFRNWRNPPPPPVIPIVTPPANPNPPIVPNPAGTPPSPPPGPTLVTPPMRQNAQRNFIAMTPGSDGQPHMIKWFGHTFHSAETGPDGVHTLRYFHNS